MGLGSAWSPPCPPQRQRVGSAGSLGHWLWAALAPTLGWHWQLHRPGAFLSPLVTPSAPQPWVHPLGWLGGAGAPHPLWHQPHPREPGVTGTPYKQLIVGVPTAPNPLSWGGHAGRDPNVHLRSAVWRLWVAQRWHVAPPVLQGGQGKARRALCGVRGGPAGAITLLAGSAPHPHGGKGGGHTRGCHTRVRGASPPPPGRPPWQSPVPAARPKIAPAGP